ncbi:MAG: hypothetical protein ACJ72N_07470 [Labedaea sp.]|jgi:hypothetical protein
MLTATQTHAVVVARMRDGTTAFLSRFRSGGMLRRRRNHAWVMTLDDAREAQTRLNGVIDLGHHHKEVAFFDACTVKAPRGRTTR